jgi:hypothetical protein
MALFVLTGVVLLVGAAKPTGAQESAQPDLWLPWEGGTAWRYIYGPHSASAPVADALDFQPPDSGGHACETFTSAFWAVAAADGKAIVLANAVEVDHGNGFRTGYYHLADKQVKTGDEVKAGQRLGRPGCCPDGGSGESCWASEPHLHFYTVSSGARRPIVGSNIGGWYLDTDGCMVRPERRACPGASLISNAPESGPAPAMKSAITVAIDVSGSMAGLASSGDVLRLAAPYLRAASVGEDVTVMTFNSHSRVIARGSEKPALESLTAELGRSSPEGNTDLLAGLGLACREMTARGGDVRQALILVSDGYHNGSRLREPHRCFAEHGWPVHILGTARPNTNLLQRIASTTGGEYWAADTIFDPACEMERLRTLVSGGAHSPCSRFLLMPGERLQFPLEVPPEQAHGALVLTSTSLGDPAAPVSVDVNLRMPGGEEFTDEMAAAHEADGRTERYALSSPPPGLWEALITGRQVPEAGVLIDVSFGTTPIGFADGPAPLIESPTETPVPGEETPAPSDESGTETPGTTTTPTGTPKPTPLRPTISPTPRPTADARR